MVDASATDAPALARELRAGGLHVSVALNKASATSADMFIDEDEEPVPQLNDGGLVGWFGTDHALHRLEHQLGWHHHFLYTSSGPSLVQMLLAKGAGGQLVVGKVTITKSAQLAHLVHAGLHRGDVVELRVNDLSAARHLLSELDQQLRERHLDPVSIGKLLQDSGRQA